MENETKYKNKKIALRSGYYFQIFDYSDVDDNNIYLRDSSIIIKYNEEKFPLYEGDTWDDVKKIDNLFGNQLGHDIDKYKVNERNEDYV